MATHQEGQILDLKSGERGRGASKGRGGQGRVYFPAPRDSPLHFTNAFHSPHSTPTHPRDKTG